MGLVTEIPGYKPVDMKAWIGASDSAKEGTYCWVGHEWCVGGPFFENGASVDGAYTNWADGEPNEGGGGEGTKLKTNSLLLYSRDLS
jgi:hypothetical protein